MKDKIWAKTLLNSYTCLERLSSAIDGMVMATGLHSSYGYNATMTSANHIINLISRKKLLINLKVLIETVIEKMPVNFARILVLKYFDKVKSQDIAKVMEISNRTYFRRLQQSVDCFSKGLKKEGFSSEIIEKMVENEWWISNVYAEIYQKEVGEKASEKDIVFNDFKILNMAYSSYKKESKYC